MFTIFGKPHRRCDGVTRREFLQAGMLSVGGLTLADLLRSEAQANIGSSNKAVILIHLDGGPPQMDLIDLKPDAPSEIRGEFRPTSTNVAGIQICELLTKTASIAEQLIFIRSLVGAAGRHDAFQCQSGFDARDLESLGGRPALGCVLTRLLGSPSDPAPTFADLMQGRPLVRNSARPGFLGPAYKPFRPDISQLFPRPLEEGMKKELANQGSHHTIQLGMVDGLTSNRLEQRATLLARLDQVRRESDASGMMAAMDRFHQQAAAILTSGRFADALDLSRATPAEIELYTAPASSIERFATAEDRFAMRKLLLARRLIEAGVRCVSVSFSDFDTHSQNFRRMKQMLPILDHGLHALITDLKERGMLDDVTIVAWGEFGRTPKINAGAGRDHWPQVGMALMAGGGMRTGQVIGATDRTASTAVTRPVTYQDVLATVYHNLGLDAARTTLIDPTGRPQYLLHAGEPIREVV